MNAVYKNIILQFIKLKTVVCKANIFVLILNRHVFFCRLTYVTHTSHVRSCTGSVARDTKRIFSTGTDAGFSEVNFHQLFILLSLHFNGK